MVSNKLSREIKKREPRITRLKRWMHDLKSSIKAAVHIILALGVRESPKQTHNKPYLCIQGALWRFRPLLALSMLVVVGGNASTKAVKIN